MAALRTRAKSIGTPVPGGSSDALFMTDVNDVDFVVKLIDNPQGKDTLVCELVMNLLAGKLGVSVPNAHLIDVPQAIIDMTDTMPGIEIRAGLHFATEYIPNSIEGVPKSLLARVSNKETFPKSVVLDIWGDNSDRDNYTNFVIAPDPFSQEGLLFYSIDFGYCFGSPSWATLEGRVQNWCRSYLKELCDEINGEDPFEETLRIANEILDAELESFVDDVPADWQMNGSNVLFLKNFLKDRRQYLPGILENNRDIFPNWTRRVVH